MRILCFFLCGFLYAIPSEAGIVLDFSFGSFFGGNTSAMNAVQAAADDINAILSNSLAAVSTDPISGAAQPSGLAATFDLYWTHKDPYSGTTQTIATPSIGANDIKIFVGTQDLSGATLGQGGLGGFGYTLSGTSGSPSEWPAAVASAESNVNTIHGRGDGPTSLSLSGSSTFSTFTANFTLNMGVNVGHLWFDTDTNNDGVTDDAATLDSN